MADRVRVSSREGEVVLWSQEAANRTLSNFMDYAEGDCYPALTVRTDTLRQLAAMCGPDYEPSLGDVWRSWNSSS